MSKKFLPLLILIIILAAILRIPGVFWGWHLFGEPTKVALHTDEMYGVNLTNQFSKKEINLREGYPLAQAFQTALVAWPLRKFLHFPFITIFYLGRLNSLFFGILTIGLVGFLARQIFRDDSAGLLAAFFLATSDLHNTYSHIFIPDVPAVFWFYLALYSAYLFVKSGSFEWLAAGAWAAGASMAAKFNNIVGLVVLLLVAFFSRRKLWALFLVLAVAAGSFYLMTGTSFTWLQMFGTNQYLQTYTAEKGNPNVLLNAFLIPLNLLVAMGLPVFILFLLMLFILVKKILADRTILRSPEFLVFGGGGLIYFILIFNFRMLPARFVLPLLPLLAILAAGAFIRMPLLQNNRRWLLPLLFIYQLLYTAPAQANFVFETRGLAGHWLRENIPAGTRLSVSAQAFVPGQFKTTFNMNQKTLVLAEQGYERYLTKNNLNYKIAGQLPTFEEIYNPNLEYGKDPLILQKILTGGTDYRLVKEFDTFTLTPEWALWKGFGYHPSLLGKVLIYQKERFDQIAPNKSKKPEHGLIQKG